MRFTLPRKQFAPALLVGLAALSSACGGIKEKDYPDEVARVICDLIYDCNCDSTMEPTASKDQCEAALKEATELAQENARVDGLTYDDECAEDGLNRIDDIGCTTPSSDPDAKCEKPCKLYYGPVEKGGSCTYSMAGYDNCAQGLACDEDGICVNPCAEVDYPAIGESCFAGQCEEGAYCLYTGIGFPTCTALPTDGQPCTDIGECAEDHVCDQSMGFPGTCMSLPGQGDPCPDDTCRQGLFCDSMTDPAAPVCAQPPQNGQPCYGGFLCDVGLTCDIETDPANPICVLGEAPVCNAWTPLVPPPTP